MNYEQIQQLYPGLRDRKLSQILNILDHAEGVGMDEFIELSTYLIEKHIKEE